MTLAALLALLLAARTVLHESIGLLAAFATMQFFLGHGEHSGLDTTTTSCGASRIFPPLTFTIDNTGVCVALALLLVAIAVWARFATLGTIQEGVGASLETSTTLCGALTPTTPLTTDVRRINRRWLLYGEDWRVIIFPEEVGNSVSHVGDSLVRVIDNVFHVIPKPLALLIALLFDESALHQTGAIFTFSRSRMQEVG
jgi:hypothetical protein